MKVILIIISYFCVVISHAHSNLEFSLKVPNINDNQPFPERYLSNEFGCTGENIRPRLEWNNVPIGTKSFAITFYDHDAPTGSGFWQWVVIDIPESIHHIPENSLPKGAKQQLNDASSATWLGPCPPKGSTHHYEIKIHALDIETLPTKLGNSAALTGYFIHMHSIASASQIFKVSR